MLWRGVFYARKQPDIRTLRKTSQDNGEKECINFEGFFISSLSLYVFTSMLWQISIQSDFFLFLSIKIFLNQNENFDGRLHINKKNWNRIFFKPCKKSVLLSLLRPWLIIRICIKTPSGIQSIFLNCFFQNVLIFLACRIFRDQIVNFHFVWLFTQRP